jgi:putative peptidoglycan lipid II flippase
MLVVYLFLLRIFHVTELRDLLRPLLGRLGRGAGPSDGSGGTPSASESSPAGDSGTERPTPERATVSLDTGLIPRISGEFDAVSFRAGPVPERPAMPPTLGMQPADPGTGPSTGSGEGPREEAESAGQYLPAEDLPGTARGGLLRDEIPLPGRRTFQGQPGTNPHFRLRRPRKK